MKTAKIDKYCSTIIFYVIFKKAANKNTQTFCGISDIYDTYYLNRNHYSEKC